MICGKDVPRLANILRLLGCSHSDMAAPLEEERNAHEILQRT